MRVQINEIIHENLNTIVAFSSNFGSAKAYWDGDEPIANSEYQVEVDINNTLGIKMYCSMKTMHALFN